MPCCRAPIHHHHVPQNSKDVKVINHRDYAEVHMPMGKVILRRKTTSADAKVRCVSSSWTMSRSRLDFESGSSIFM